MTSALPASISAPHVELCPNCEHAIAGKFVVLRLCSDHRERQDPRDGFVRLDQLLEDIQEEDVIDGEDVADSIREFYR